MICLLGGYCALTRTSEKRVESNQAAFAMDGFNQRDVERLVRQLLLQCAQAHVALASRRQPRGPNRYMLPGSSKWRPLQESHSVTIGQGDASANDAPKSALGSFAREVRAFQNAQ